MIRNVLTVFALVLLAACGSSGPASTPGGTGGGGVTPSSGAAVVKVLSNRADLVSGGDALVEVVMTSGALADLKMTLNGADVTSAFAKRSDGRILGVVNGLALGSNALVATVGGATADSATLVNHPDAGPVLSGPQLKPWTCQNSAAKDANCTQPPEYSYLYKSTDPTKTSLQAYDPANPPTDVANTTTDTGLTVPFIVRQELGYQDRDQYKIAVSFSRLRPGPVPSRSRSSTTSW